MAFNDLRKRWETYLVGKAGQLFPQAYLDSVDRMADWPESTHIGPLVRQRAQAIAFKTPGSRHYKNAETKSTIIKALCSLYETEYNMETSFENWWLVEVGIPLRLLDILILMYDELPDRDEWIKKYTIVMLHFKDAYAISSHGKPETGANLAWKCQLLFLIGILNEDTSQFDWVNEQLPTMLTYSHLLKMPHIGEMYDDGFYPDGSFIQHYMFAYTGGYGKNLLSTLTGMLCAFGNTPHLVFSDEAKQFLYQTIFDCFVPLMANGRFMDMARGREPSRSYLQDRVTGIIIIRTMALLSTMMPDGMKAKVQSLVKRWLMYKNNADDVLRDETIMQEHFLVGSLVPVLEHILSNAVLPTDKESSHKTFGVMAKAVHHSENFSLGISMYSPEIACYEQINGEGKKFWHMSDGVTYLYTADSNQYNGDYYATVDMQRLPGTTVDRSPTRNTDEYFLWYTPEARNLYRYAGGTDFDARFGTAGMRYRGQGNGKTRDLEVKKTWFMFDDVVLCMGSGITSTTGNPIETIVDNHRLGKDCANLITIDECEAAAAKNVLETPRSMSMLHLCGNDGPASDIGYCFPYAPNVTVLCETRKGTWIDVVTNDTGEKENTFVSILIPHGERPENASYAYTLLPGKSLDETRAYASAPRVRVLALTDTVHAAEDAVHHITALQFFEAGNHEGIIVSAACSIIIKQQAGIVDIALSDPERNEHLIDIALPFAAVNSTAQDGCLVYENGHLCFDSRNMDRGTAHIRLLLS